MVPQISLKIKKNCYKLKLSFKKIALWTDLSDYMDKMQEFLRP